MSLSREASSKEDKNFSGHELFLFNFLTAYTYICLKKTQKWVKIEHFLKKIFFC